MPVHFLARRRAIADSHVLGAANRHGRQSDLKGPDHAGGFDDFVVVAQDGGDTCLGDFRGESDSESGRELTDGLLRPLPSPQPKRERKRQRDW